MEYDEEAELDRYVINHYSDLMTTLERFALARVIALEKSEHYSKAEHYSPRVAEYIKVTMGHFDDPEVIAALSEGVDVFLRRTSQRIMRDYPEKIFINRCPKCNRVVRTPKAKLCLWCGYSWHKQGG